MDSTNFDKMFNRKAAEYLNANGKKDDDLMEREVRIPEHMLPKKIVLDDDDAKKEKKMVEENEEELGKTIPEQILEAYKNQNYFKALAVAEPTADDIGDPIWPVTVAELSKAFRKRSLLTHPDKNPGDKKAREAFDVLSECHQKLKNEETKREALNAFAKKAFERCVRTIPSYARERRK
ncbi:unnamed protein product [Bathycoccus prasinos]